MNLYARGENIYAHARQEGGKGSLIGDSIVIPFCYCKSTIPRLENRTIVSQLRSESRIEPSAWPCSAIPLLSEREGIIQMKLNIILLLLTLSVFSFLAFALFEVRMRVKTL